jgi:hypothetical protein
MSRSARLLIVQLVLLAAPSFGDAALSAQDAHTVVRGNTLWDLARSYYGDPFQWTRIYEANRDRIQNPDLIYPGQALRMPGADGTVTEITVAPADDPEPPLQPAEPSAAEPPVAGGDPQEPLPGRVSTGDAPLAFGNAAGIGGATRPEPEPRTPPPPRTTIPEDLVAAAPFVIPEGAEAPRIGRIVGYAGAEEVRAPRSTARLYDRMSLAREGGTLAPGSRLQSYRLGAVVPGVGRVAHPTGVLVVEAAGADTPVGEIVVQLGALRVGDLVRPLPTSGLQPGVEPARVADGLRATVVAVAEDHVLQNIGDHLFIDVGRERTSIGDHFVPEMPGGDPAHPEGRLQVVAVQDGFATLRIVNIVNPVFETGLAVRQVRRMPGR